MVEVNKSGFKGGDVATVGIAAAAAFAIWQIAKSIGTWGKAVDNLTQGLGDIGTGAGSLLGNIGNVVQDIGSIPSRVIGFGDRGGLLDFTDRDNWLNHGVTWGAGQVGDAAGWTWDKAGDVGGWVGDRAQDIGSGLAAGGEWAADTAVDLGGDLYSGGKKVVGWLNPWD